MISESIEMGRLRADAPGPTLIVVGGLHGNEPAGVSACRRLLARLDESSLRAGEVVAFIGNPAALAAGRRQIARDMNRQWTTQRIAAARARDAGEDAEERALVALADALDDVLARARGPIFVLDLHTSSSEGVPFMFLGSEVRDRDFAARFPLTGIAGMHPMLPGVLVRHLTDRGCIALAIEGGQSESAEAATNLDAVLTIGLVASGLFDEAEVADFSAAQSTLQRARGDLPQLIEAIARHHVDPAGGFRMEPGFRNIARVAAGAVLAREHGAAIKAECDGFVLLPLYQSQGEDGFFFGR